MYRTIIIIPITIIFIISCNKPIKEPLRHTIKSLDTTNLFIRVKIEGISQDGKLLLYPDTIIAAQHNRIESWWYADLLFDGKYLMRRYKKEIGDTIAYISNEEHYLRPNSKAVRIRFTDRNKTKKYYTILVYSLQKGLCGAYDYDESLGGKPIILSPVGDIIIGEIDTNKVTIYPFRNGLIM